MRIRSTAGAIASGLVLTLGASVGLSTTAGAAEAERPSAAKQALADARAVLSGTPDVAGRDATMVLRDLFLVADQLSGADAKAARSILARPTDPDDGDYYGDGVDVETECGDNVCLHWAESGEEASTPELAATILETMDSVHQTYVDAGYRAPIQDAGQGGNTMTDIYLANMGDEGLYGYCTVDVDAEGNPDWIDGWTLAPYCALDNDFVEFETDTVTALEAMQATAAHEYFHAVQYAYDANDDTWIYETTATWAEDEVFDDANDSWNYLPYGQMGDPSVSEDYVFEGPGVSLDYAFFPYGNWIFFRFLTERYTAEDGGIPTLVRDVWEALDTTGGAPEVYSLEAVESTLAGLGTTMPDEYGDFSVVNQNPGAYYEEALDEETFYTPAAWLMNPASLTKKQPKATRKATLDHLTSATGPVFPFAKGYDLKVAVDMTAKKAGSRAAVIVHNNDGTLTTHWVQLNKKGNGSKKVPFSEDKVSYVEVTLVNASTAMVDCGTDQFWDYSCGGFGKYENQKQEVSYKAVK